MIRDIVLRVYLAKSPYTTTYQVFYHKDLLQPASSIVVKDADTKVSESQSVEPYAVEDPDYTANIAYEFVEDVDVECGPEEGIELRGGLEDVANHGGGRGMVV